MKRADLIAGQDYLYSTSNDWASAPYGHRGHRVTVVDAGRWNSTTGGYGYGKPATTDVTLPDGRIVQATGRPASTGARADGVLIIGTEASNSWRAPSTTQATVVDPRFLRGPWAEANATVEGAIRERARREDAAARARTQRIQRNAAQHARLAALLGEDSTRTWLPVGDSRLDVHPDDLDRLLRLAEVGQRAAAADVEQA